MHPDGGFDNHFILGENPVKKYHKLLAVIRLSLTAVFLVLGSRNGHAQPTPQTALNALDVDGNGLCDDTERKALLEVFLKELPELQGILDVAAAPIEKAKSKYQEDFEEGNAKIVAEGGGGKQDGAKRHYFDMNGDGKVTVEEQSRELPPLSILLPRRIIDSNRKIPWAIDIFPEWLSSVYLQEDVATGEIAEHSPRGTIAAKASQPTATLQPSKTRAGGGIEFTANSGRFFTMPGQRDAPWNYRWCLLTFRIDAASGSDEQTVLLDLNRGNTSNKSSPKIWYHKKTGLHIQYVGLNKGGLDRRIMTSENVVADGRTWNVLVCGIRYGQMFASVNGLPLATQTQQPPRFSGELPAGATSYLGDASQGNMAWAYDALVFGLTEPSEAMVRKLTGWAAHRLGFQASLPEKHPYKTARPVLDAEDFPRRYVHDDVKWNIWGRSLKNKAATLVNQGQPPVKLEGFERVFYDDFRADRVRASTSGEGDLWVGPGFNTAVGGAAPLVIPGQNPNAYPYDAAKHKQILSLVQQSNKQWRGSAFYSVNNLGYGYTWKGPKVFRIRCMFPEKQQKELAGGLFPAFWSYGTDSLFWRTSNRIEVDWFEFDGKNGSWLNGLSAHYHYPHLKNNLFAKNTGSYKRYKGFGGDLSMAKSKIPGGLYFWDGKYHTWEFVVEQNMTYINVSLPLENGKDQWVEVSRCPTVATYLEELDLQLDYALKSKATKPQDGERQDFVVDWIEVLQKSSQIEAVPDKPFIAKPILSGSVADGSKVICTPNLEGITDVRYYWFADGYPLTYGPDNSYVISPAEIGKNIRCMVKAVGARDMPEAWSNIIK